jgi:hypothetical protein
MSCCLRPARLPLRGYEPPDGEEIGPLQRHYRPRSHRGARFAEVDVPMFCDSVSRQPLRYPLEFRLAHPQEACRLLRVHDLGRDR